MSLAHFGPLWKKVPSHGMDDRTDPAGGAPCARLVVDRHEVDLPPIREMRVTIRRQADNWFPIPGEDPVAIGGVIAGVPDVGVSRLWYLESGEGPQYLGPQGRIQHWPSSRTLFTHLQAWLVKTVAAEMPAITRYTSVSVEVGGMWPCT